MKHESEWRALTLQDQRSLKFVNPKRSENNETYKELNDWVKEKLNEDHPITTATLIDYLLEIDNDLGEKTFNSLKHMCYEFMEKYGYSF